MDSFITLYLHIGADSPVAVSVDQHGTISDLDQMLQISGQHTYLYKNIKMHAAFSFRWFGINNGDHIFVKDDSTRTHHKKSSFRKLISKCEKPKQQKRIMEAPTPQPTLPETVSQENARIKDQFFRKVEGTVVCYRKIMKRFTHMSVGDEEDAYANNMPTIIADEPLVCPATEELPKFWSDDDDSDFMTSPLTD